MQGESHPVTIRTKNSGKNQDAEHHQGAPLKGGVKHSGAALSAHVGKAHEQPPMTPPRISGVSLAPLPGVDCLAAAASALPDLPSDVPGHQRRGSQSRLPDVPNEGPSSQAPKPAVPRRPPAIRVAALNGATAPQPPLSFGSHAPGRGAGAGAAGAGAGADAAAAAAAAGPTGKGNAAAEVPQLVAEGRAVSLMRQPPEEQVPGSPDLNLAHYREINDADSLCGTPAMSLQMLKRDFDLNLPLGPLSPSPLSPSILTLCGGLDALDLRPQDRDVFTPSSVSGVEHGRPPMSPMWDASLSDLRECNSPELCDTPKSLPH